MLFGGAIPILPGKTERARRLADELDAHRAEYEALNARHGVIANAIWISHSRDGRDIYVNVYDVAPEGHPPMSERVWDPNGSAYDRWWLEWVNDVLGIDIAELDPLVDSSGGIAAFLMAAEDGQILFI